jgi:predicted O-methyltransferase YrrM
VGWLVPEHRRANWRLILGRAREHLPALLNEAPVDIFIHDSEHSFENQLFEFSAGWQALRPGGILVATDINWSDAFETFRDIARPRVQWIDHTCALAFKPSPRV